MERFIVLTLLLVVGSASGSAAGIQGLSLLDLPVFSRGDRPSSMDKTLGAIFSKVALSTANQTSPTSNGKAIDAPAPINQQPASSGSTTTAAGAAPTTATPAASTPSGGAARARPVFEFDTRVFDFLPFERTPAPPLPDAGRASYNPNVPGLRGPSRINTARHPPNGQQFHLRPTLPPLVDITRSSSTTPRTTTTTSATTTTTEATTTTAAPTTSTTPEAVISEEEEVDVDTTLPTTTASSSTSTTTLRAEEERASSNEELKRQQSAWNVQVYGSATLFALLGVMAAGNLVRLRSTTRRLLSTSHGLSIQLLVLFMAITRTIHLLYDAYNARRRLPPALAFSLFNVAFPCLSSALAILLLGIFKATKLQVVPSVLVKPGLWAALVAFHFALSLSIDIVVGSVGGLYSLHLASQAYFVLWSLAMSLGYLAAFAPAMRAARCLQTETTRSQLTALHVHGASLPRYLPQPTLRKAVRLTLAASVIALLVAAFQLYGMFGVYGLPWRQPAANSPSPAPTHHIVLTPEFLARYQGLQKDRTIGVEALREMLGLPLTLESTPDRHGEQHWPVASEHFWPWYTYQLIARLLELLMAGLIAYVASQPFRTHQPIHDKNGDGNSSSASSAATKKSSLWLLRPLGGGSMETLSTLCCQSNRPGGGGGAGGGAGRHGVAEARELNGGMGIMTDLSPVKSVASESAYPPLNMHNYCYSNPGGHHHGHQASDLSDRAAAPLPAYPAHYGSKRRCGVGVPSAASSVLINDSGFIRFRDAPPSDASSLGDQTAYEEVDRQRILTVPSGESHIYQELGYKAPSLTYYSTGSSVTSSSNKATTATPSTCTYEHLCRRGLAGYYEPQLYEMQLPNNAQLLSLLAKDSCHGFQPCNLYGGSLSGQHPPPPSRKLIHPAALVHGQQQQQHAIDMGQHHHCHCPPVPQSSCCALPAEQHAALALLQQRPAPNYESYGSKPEAQAPMQQQQQPAGQLDSLQVINSSPANDLQSVPIFL